MIGLKAMRPEAQWWMETSEQDEATARQLLASGFYNACAFYAQQAAEKALKAVLIARRRQMARIHSCVRLLEQLERLGDRVPQRVMASARRLDPHYTEARYPNEVGGPPQLFYDRPIAEDCIRWMESIKAFAKSLLP